MQIKNLFDPSRDIYRTIEKVITYNAAQEVRLRAEISEYIVTESIEEQFERLLSRMQAAMEAGGSNEIGVWVSGFYGSGKSSLTKYLGLALDENVKVDGVRFLEHLRNRLNKPTTKALLTTVAQRYPAAVILLDLASDMLAGATMEEVSTVLYYKVLQWAGYSRNLKVAALERKLKKDGRFDEFTARIQQDAGLPWQDCQNDALVIDALVPEIANQIYPALFRTPTAFNTETADIIRFEPDRVKEMLEVIRETTGKQHVLFIIDEVGQYVGSRPHLILNLDGLAKNLKSIGGGKVWIIGTAQQTLTEDDPRASLNSPELYKLKDRFPIQIDLEAADIKEICYRRLLAKSPAGERSLGELFDRHGPELRFCTKLQDARFYDSGFDKTSFTNLYPFLPAHFDILLHLLGALAKSTGGIGLRSAIKVIQDILIEGIDGQPVANREVGWLATTVTLYDALEKDIRRAAPSIHQGIGKVFIRFPASPIHLQVAKTVAILQILGNMPATRQNVAALLHPSVDTPSQLEAVEAAAKDLIADAAVPFNEKDGSLCFFSEKINDIAIERSQIPLRSIETRRLQNDALREAFTPLPTTRLAGILSVTSGLKIEMPGQPAASLTGEREPIQTAIIFADPAAYEGARRDLVDQSRQPANRNAIYLIGHADPDTAALAGEIYRSQEIANRHRADPDQEVRDYCKSQLDLAASAAGNLQRTYKRALGQGSFIFRGQVTAVESLHNDVLEAAKRHLAEVAVQVFDRYNEAPERVDTSLAERFLRTGLRGITSALDPLRLVKLSGGNPHVDSGHKALTSLRDFIERSGSVDGKRLSEHFSDAPFGWSPDTLRYLVAALLLNGEIAFRVGGREITAVGQQAIDALRSNVAFKTVGVSLRDVPPPDMLARASQRLTQLAGVPVLPLEDEIAKTAVRHFSTFQLTCASLAERIARLGLPGVEKVVALNLQISDALATDGSDAVRLLGAAASSLYDGLVWTGEVDAALRRGLETTITGLREAYREVNAMPDAGIPGRLRQDLAAELERIGQRLNADNFYTFQADLSTALTHLHTRVREAAVQQAAAQDDALAIARHELETLPEWGELSQEEQHNAMALIDGLALSVEPGLAGLKRLINNGFVIQNELQDQKELIKRLGRERRLEHEREERERRSREGRVRITRDFPLPARFTSMEHIRQLIAQLQALESEIDLYKEIDITLKFED